jgi:hypothetical protein
MASVFAQGRHGGAILHRRPKEAVADHSASHGCFPLNARQPPYFNNVHSTTVSVAPTDHVPVAGCTFRFPKPRTTGARNG